MNGIAANASSYLLEESFHQAVKEWRITIKMGLLSSYEKVFACGFRGSPYDV
jgi:hypothetical protein